MTVSVSRRTLLRAALSGAASASLSSLMAHSAIAKSLAGGLSSSREPLTIARLSDRLVAITGAGGNVVVSKTADGLLMVDGGLAERSAELLKRVADEFDGARIKALFNTHWHWDHTGSNEALAKQGASIVAHENTKLWLGAEIISRWEDRTYPPRPAKALPTDTFFYDSKHFELGGDTVEYGFLPQAHTDGDIYVFFPNHNVLVAGDVVTGGSYPILDYSTNGWLGGMIRGLRLLLTKIDTDTRIVPGAGPLRTRADVQAQLDMCLAMIGRIGGSYYKGQTWEEFSASNPTREFDAQWGNPDVFLRTAYEGAWQHVNEIRRFR